MKLLVSIMILLFVGAAYGSTVYFTAAPVSVRLPNDAILSASEMPMLNSFLLGLSSKAPSTWTGTGDLFSRPKALAVVSVMGVKTISLSHLKAAYPLNGDITNMDSVSETLKRTFGTGFEWIEATSGKVSGTKIAGIASEQQERQIKARVAPLRGEIQDIYKIADSLKKSGAQLSASAPIQITIRVTGLPIAAQISYVDYRNGLEELEAAVDFLTEALSAAYGDQALVEVTTEQSPDVMNVDAADGASQLPHKIRKREALTASEAHIVEIRRALNVYQFTSSDYPAIFAIFAGVIIVLSIAVLFIAVGIWNMDPGKDSIIYRMTTTRMKKD
uniref:Renin receptor n=3 Tax=Parascaris univalens TaxID=6257 RepID=A0A915AZD7_PARUN